MSFFRPSFIGRQTGRIALLPGSSAMTTERRHATLSLMTTRRVVFPTMVALALGSNTSLCAGDITSFFSKKPNPPTFSLAYLAKTAKAPFGKDKNNDYSNFSDDNEKKLRQLGFGGIMGYCSAMAVKEAGRLAAIAVGTVFLLSQFSASRGYATLHWDKIKKDAFKALHLKQSKLTTKEEVQVLMKRFMKMAQFNLPGGAGFATGFYLGLNYPIY